MEKRVWTMPQAEVEKFEMNAYCASGCGDTGTHYNFKCTAGSGWSGEVYIESGATAGFQKDEDIYLSGYHACGAEHVTEKSDDFVNGYYVPDIAGWFGYVESVVIWRGANDDNTHCTTVLDKENWETVKS